MILYHHGGIFVAPTIRSRIQLQLHVPDLVFYMDQMIPCQHQQSNQQPRLWYQPTAISIPTTRTNTNDSTPQQVMIPTSIHILAATAKHPQLKCLLQELISPSFVSSYYTVLDNDQEQMQYDQNNNNNNNWWYRTVDQLIRTTNWDPSCEPQCCSMVVGSTNDKEVVDPPGTIILPPYVIPSKKTHSEQHRNQQPAQVHTNSDTKSQQQQQPRRRFHVSIHEEEESEGEQNENVDTTQEVAVVVKAFPKRSISSILRQNKCAGGWFCNRCLRTPVLGGSIGQCQPFCRNCYESIVCNKDDHDDTNDKKKSSSSDSTTTIPEQKTIVTINVNVIEDPNEAYQKIKRIPRIIHQTWFEPLTMEKYPHLHRLQNSWIYSGWEYRFYTDEQCRFYIEKHYPDRFVLAYDAILPGAFKADLFRLLVLFIDGGIYSDIDVHLDATLDSFLTLNMAFFVPRDVPLDYWPDSNYCLWNGLLGAAPGHPLIGQALEDVVNIITNRIDYLDIERDLCSKNRNAAIWKLRTIPILLLTGPCRLGMSINKVLGHDDIDPVRGYAFGWLDTRNVGRYHYPTNHDWGDALLLLTDRFDLGELRFTDIDRNLLIASSNQDRLAKQPISENKDKDEDTKKRTTKTTKTPLHYSKSESDIVGEFGTYIDKNISNEYIRIRIHHSYDTLS